MSPQTIVVGGGVFGLTAALALRGRGHSVVVVDSGRIPHPLAASTDISKVVRMEYGSDAGYMALAERARTGWLDWNDRWRSDGSDPLYHETGVLMLTMAPMTAGGYEFESFRMLQERGHRPERMTPAIVARRFPAWHAGACVDGFYHVEGGYVESGKVITALRSWAVREGIELREGVVAQRLQHRGTAVEGILTGDGQLVRASRVVVAAGAWSGRLVGLERALRPTGHAVFHLRPAKPELFTEDRFPTFTADVSRTGYYGFSLHSEGIVKIANHGPGRLVDPDGVRAVKDEDVAQLRTFLRSMLPGLAQAEIVATRLCLYSDSGDGDFWIANDPDHAGVTVASGGSGHAFKFAPLLGDLIADAVEGRENTDLARFRWRPEVAPQSGAEAARYLGT